MLRAIAVIAAAGVCTLAGCNSAARLRRRYTALSEICSALRRMQMGMQGTNQTVAALLNGCGERETGTLFLFLAREIERGETPLAAWEQAAAAGDAAICALAENDKKAMAFFFSLLGGSDRCSQVQHILATQRMLSAQCTEAKHAYEKNGRLYCSLGLVLGAGVAILLL